MVGGVEAGFRVVATSGAVDADSLTGPPDVELSTCCGTAGSGVNDSRVIGDPVSLSVNEDPVSSEREVGREVGRPNGLRVADALPVGAGMGVEAETIGVSLELVMGGPLPLAFDAGVPVVMSSANETADEPDNLDPMSTRWPIAKPGVDLDRGMTREVPSRIGSRMIRLALGEFTAW
jgi:hypothetical protein